MQIDLLTRDRRGYTLENYAAPLLKEGLERAGSSVRVISLEEGGLRHYMKHVAQEPPDWTLALSDLLSQQTPLCDTLAIPHLQWEQGVLAESIHYVDSRFGHLAYGEPLEEVFFLPHAVDSQLKGEKSRPFEVVLFDALVDLPRKRATLEALYTAEIAGKIEQSLSLKEHPLTVAKKIVSQGISLNDCLYGIEEGRRATLIEQVVSSCQGYSLHLFGDHIGNHWLKRIPKGVHLHTPLSYIESIEVLKEAQILVSPHLAHTSGSDRWMLTALQVGTLPLMPPNRYLEELVGDEILFYRSIEELNEKILYFLAHPEERRACVEAYKERLIPPNTWERRAEQIVVWMEEQK